MAILCPVTDWDLKPRTVGELLDAAFYVYRRQFPRLVLVAVIVSFPALVITAIYAHDAAAAASDYWTRIMDNARQNTGDVEKAFTNSFNAISKLQPFLLLSQFLQSLERAGGVVAMSIVGAAALRRERAPSVAKILKQAAPRLPAAVLVQMVIDYFLSICMTCCFPVGIVVGVLFACTGAAIALERGPMETSLRASAPAAIRWAALPFVTAIDGIVRSVKLSASGPVLGRGTLYLFFLLTFVGIADLAAMAIGGILGGNSGAWFWAQHCAEALFLPVWGLGITFWYADLRVRREGLDLAVAA